MKLIWIVTVFYGIIFLLPENSEEALYRSPPSPSKNPKYPNHCYDSEANAYYEVSEDLHQRVGFCQHVKCHSDFSWVAMRYVFFGQRLQIIFECTQY